MVVMMEFGLLPKSATDRAKVDKLILEHDKDGDGTFDFEEFLHLVTVLRAYSRRQKEEGTQRTFVRYDRDRSGTLCMQEISNLLSDISLAPSNRKEQFEIAELIHEVDEDTSGCIDMDEFSGLCQRIDERLKALRFEKELEEAMRLGFSESQLREMRW